MCLNWFKHTKVSKSAQSREHNKQTTQTEYGTEKKMYQMETNKKTIKFKRKEENRKKKLKKTVQTNSQPTTINHFWQTNQANAYIHKDYTSLPLLVWRYSENAKKIEEAQNNRNAARRLCVHVHL